MTQNAAHSDADQTSGTAGGAKSDDDGLASFRTWQERRKGLPSGDSPSVSIVIPTLNEADHVADCIDSVISACRRIPAFEIILVDSNSDDGTVEIASEYPVTILRIRFDEYASPGAGRHVGAMAARGKQILFVDGDMRVTEGWLTGASKYLATHDDVAAIDGHLNETLTSTTRLIQAPSGVMLYDADVLAEVGGFDPFLQGHEDIDLGLRVGAAGYRRVRFPVVVARHTRPSGVSEIRRRWHNGYLTGIGQTARKSLTSPRRLGALLVRKWDLVAFMCWYFLGLLTAISGGLLVGWLAASAILFAGNASIEGASAARERWLNHAVASISAIRGFVSGSRDPTTFPRSVVTVVQDHPPVSGTAVARASDDDMTTPEQTGYPSP